MIFSWLLVIISAYFFFSLSNLGDKLVLAGPPKPVSYTFYAGLLTAPVIILIPFISLQMPVNLVWMVAVDAVVFLLGMYFTYRAVEDFEISRVMPVIGSVQPIFIFFLSWFLFGYQQLSATQITAFMLLVAGSFLISIERKFLISFSYLRITLSAGLMFSADYVFSKYIYLSVPFLTGFFWMKICVFIFVISMLVSAKNRREIFSKRIISAKKSAPAFVLAQSAGGVASVLQSFAVFITPVAFLPIVSSLRGIQYFFLFLITLFFSLFFPKILKEKISKPVIIQKIAAIILITAGLALLLG